MRHKGFSRVGLSALDLDKTHEFYEAFWGLISGRRPIHIKEGRAHTDWPPTAGPARRRPAFSSGPS
jgi:hypothetical protein